jgi:hypothetical protein
MDLKSLASSIAAGAKLLASDPASYMKEQKGKASLKLAVAAVVALSAAGLLLNLASIVVASFLQAGSVGRLPIDADGFTSLLVAYPLSFLVLSLFASGVAYLLMRLLGGKGKFIEVFYLMAVSHFPVSLLFSYLVWLLTMPLLASLSMNPLDLASMAVVQVIILVLESAVPLYLLTFALREAGQFTTVRALLCWFVPIGILVGSYVGLTMMTLQFMAATGLSPADVSGFDGLKTQFAFAYPINASDSRLLLMFNNPGLDLGIDGSGGRASREGRVCAVSSMWLEDSVGRVEGPMVIRSRASSTLVVGLSGAGCGGATGESYNVTISVPSTRNGEQSALAGSVSGQFVSGSVMGLNETVIEKAVE